MVSCRQLVPSMLALQKAGATPAGHSLELRGPPVLMTLSTSTVPTQLTSVVPKAVPVLQKFHFPKDLMVGDAWITLTRHWHNRGMGYPQVLRVTFSTKTFYTTIHNCSIPSSNDKKDDGHDLYSVSFQGSSLQHQGASQVETHVPSAYHQGRRDPPNEYGHLWMRPPMPVSPPQLACRQQFSRTSAVT